jgi:hypothetical protein
MRTIQDLTRRLARLWRRAGRRPGAVEAHLGHDRLSRLVGVAPRAG